jgi:hypothetical protein
MTTTTRWLIWDGIYSDDGSCNRRLVSFQGVSPANFVDGSDLM